MPKHKPRVISTLGIVLVLLLAAGFLVARPGVQSLLRPQKAFSGERAYQHVLTQLQMGPRTPGTEAHAQAVAWMVRSLEQAGWKAEIQKTERMGHPIYNVVARRGSGRPWVILGAHYDSRMSASEDPDPENVAKPVPGANDGASGVAVLLELARVLPERLDRQLWLVFFDAEDQGNLPGWDWILGSQAFADHLQGAPDAVVVIDMIGDADLDVYWERSSSPELLQSIWAQAAALGYGDHFIPKYNHTILDDHRPFLNKGIPAVDVIDFDYPYWHTVADTADKVSAESLEMVGKTLQSWILSGAE